MRDNTEPRIRDRNAMTQVARRLRHEPTYAEARLWEIVRRKQCGGLRFLRQHDLGHYVLDFYCAFARVAVELDGGVHDLPEVRANDAERAQGLSDSFGVRFVRLRNDFVLTATEEEIKAVLIRECACPPSPR